jgi:hypothetical protein
MIGVVLFCLLNLTGGEEARRVVVTQEFDRGLIVELKDYDPKNDRNFLVPKMSCNQWNIF